MLRLPIEIIRHILTWLPKSALLHLCTTSRTLYDQAAPLLFHHVKLHESRNEQVVQWCQLIADHADLALSVKSLSLPLLLGGKDCENNQKVAELHGMLSLALRALENLKSLAILNSILNQPNLQSQPSHIDVNIFLGCSFRLKSFSYGEFPPHRARIDIPWTSTALTAFLDEQDQIRDWRTALELEDLARGAKDTGLLPNLAIVRTTYTLSESAYYEFNTLRLFALLGSRKITQLWLRIIGYRHIHMPIYDKISDAFKMFALCGKSLTHFHLHLHMPKGILPATHAAILGIIPQTFPRLKFFDDSEAGSSIVGYTIPLVYPMLTFRSRSTLRMSGHLHLFCKCLLNSNTLKP